MLSPTALAGRLLRGGLEGEAVRDDNEEVGIQRARHLADGVVGTPQAEMLLSPLRAQLAQA